jgi:transcriptional regulator with XRE-family HTH domain
VSNLPVMRLSPHADLTADEAADITRRIKKSAGELMMLIAEAYQGRVWLPLGYASWHDYTVGEFDHAPLRLPPEERKAVGVWLRKQGMSQRAIADAVGVAQRTVSNDLQAGEQNCSPDPQPITGLDGKTYKRKPPNPPPSTSLLCESNDFPKTLKLVSKNIGNLLAAYELNLGQIEQVEKLLDRTRRSLVKRKRELSK